MIEPDDIDDVFAGMDAALDCIEAILARLDRRPQDVPLHQRGFGVMDEEGA
jgi:hypothetical protein